MSDQKPKMGKIISADLTVSNAPEIRDFYKEVVGWGIKEMPLEDENGKYSDYVTTTQDGEWVGGVCHRRGQNADLPKGWIIYIAVENVSESIQKAKENGGKILKEMKDGEKIVYAMIEDPAGAVFAAVLLA